MVQRYDGKRLISSFQWHLTRNAPNQLRNVFLEVFSSFCLENQHLFITFAEKSQGL